MSAEVENVGRLKKVGLFAAFFGGLVIMHRIAQWGGAWAYVGALGVVAICLLFALGANRVFRPGEKIRAPMRRYMLRLGLAMSAYAVLLLTATTLHRQGLTHGPVGYLIALTPGLAIVACIASVGLYLREETDEFHRQALVQSLLWGTAATLSIATVWGFLETFDLAPHAPGWAAVPVFSIAMGLAQTLISRRYRD